ncbi:MAG: NADP-dependent malic enzyme [Rhodospirillaceae bacterium]|nr:NADP-dependent malic enzyme [Rhodospirillaceae bacterium]|tara:strand:- start:13294 stop:15663 length:2370 start_codon:yes stop_codon:yes gene_type:complete
MARKAKKAPARKSAAKKSTAKSNSDSGTGQNRISNLEQEALALHAGPPPGKLSIAPLKTIRTQRDLSLAYSPGVAAPCLKIAEDENTAYDYTNKGNMVAVISNGTAVLGLGDLGAIGAKPVMEGKCVLFKTFADIDAVDLEVETRDVEEFINCVRFLGPSFGGINLEDIKAPECFIIEQRLKEIMDIPVFHDDQHGTAVIAAAGLINALDLTGRDLKKTTMVVNGAGAAAIACLELFVAMGFTKKNITLCDSRGVVYQGREDGMNQWKSAHAIDTDARTLEDAMKGADIFFGVSVAGAVTKKMIKSMADKPIIFALANPDPEITPEDVRAVRKDGIIATGRSDYPNQINNVLGFPYIFRGALDVRARRINDEMKVAAAKALAELAREDVPDEVSGAYSGQRLQFGPDYLIPTPFDPRLITAVPPAVAEAAIKTGVARKNISNIDSYKSSLEARLDPTVGSLNEIFEQVKKQPKRVVFAEGEEEKVIRAAQVFRNSGYGTPVLIGRDDVVADKMAALGFEGADAIEAHNARLSKRNKQYTDYLYERLARNGALYRDCQRMVNRDRNIFAACMVACGDADAMVTGLTRNSPTCWNDLARAIEIEKDQQLFGLSVVSTRDRTVFIADTLVHERPTSEQLADFAVQSAAKARELGHEPRVALLSHTSFGGRSSDITSEVKRAVEILDSEKRDFAYEGEMTVSVALDPDMKTLYPFSRLKGPANVLIMPGLFSAAISSRLLQKLGGGTVIGPLLVGLSKPAQIARLDATVSDIVTDAVLAAHQARKTTGKTKRK